MQQFEPEATDAYGPAIDETDLGRRDTLRRRWEYSLFALALALQVGAIVLRTAGSGFIEVVGSNWVAMTAYLVGLAAVVVRYRGWDRRKADPGNHTFYLLASPLAGIWMVGVVGADRVTGFTNTAVLVPGLIASSLAWGWAHNSRMAPRSDFVEATETARLIFWGWQSLAALTLIQLLTRQLTVQVYEIPELVYSTISLGAFLVLVSTGYTHYMRAQDRVQTSERRREVGDRRLES